MYKSVDYSAQTHRAGWKPLNVELLSFMLIQKPEHWLGKVVSVTLGQLDPITGTLGLWCFAGRLLPVLNTQHSNTFVSLAHLHKEMFPFGQKFSGEVF